MARECYKAGVSLVRPLTENDVIKTINTINRLYGAAVEYERAREDFHTIGYAMVRRVIDALLEVDKVNQVEKLKFIEVFEKSLKEKL